MASDYADRAREGWQRHHPDLDLLTFETAIRLRRIGRIVDKAMETIAAERGLTVTGDYEALSSLRRAEPEPLQPTALAERAMISAPGMTGRLDRLEQAGLVERRPNPEDRRAIDVYLTAEGRRVADDVFMATAAELDTMMSYLGRNELRTTAGLLRKLLTALEAAQQPLNV